MELQEVERLIEERWGKSGKTTNRLIRSFRIFEEKLKFHMNYSLPGLYVRDYINIGGISTIELYDPEFIIEHSKEEDSYELPSIMIGRSHYYYHYYNLVLDVYFTIDNTTSSVESVHTSLSDIEDFISEDFGARILEQISNMIVHSKVEYLPT